jgi:hypothetical protein
MNIFEQFKSVLGISAAGEAAAAPANDVRPLFPTCLGRPPHLTTSANTTAQQTANAMPRQTYDAAARSPDNVLPLNPFAPGSPPTQGSSRGAHIDLTSSPRQSPSYDRKPKRRPDTTLARPPSRYQKSVEERRLIGDYGYGMTRISPDLWTERANLRDSTPADSVKVPDPISYFTSSQPSSRPAMVKVRSWTIR